MIQLVDTVDFLTRLTKGKMNQRQTASAAAVLRANGLCFYDNWSRSHSTVLNQLDSEASKKIVLKALNIALTKY